MSDVLLDDGTVAVVRPLGPDDHDALTLLHDGVSEGSFRLRFFGAGRRLGHDYVAHLFSDDGAAISLVALVRDRVVALATAELEDATTAEVAFLVADDHRGHGVGALRSLRAWPLLEGYRGAPRADVTALEQAVTALGALATEVPEVAELDLNPVLVDVDGLHLVDVKVRLDRTPAPDRGVPRRLRDPR